MGKHIFLLPVLMASPAAAQVVTDQTASPAQGDVSVTIYSEMALVEDVRNVSLPAGTSRQEFPDVSASIRPETVTLTGDGIEIAEQNFDYDLLSPEKLMQKAEGQSITIIRKDPVTGVTEPEQVKVLAVNGGVVIESGGKVEVLRDDGTPTRVIFDRIPPNLRARPTLSVTLDSAKSGTRPLTLSYLSSGLGWKADYVGLFDEAKNSMDLQGWVTLTNSSGTAYRDAKLTLAAGDVLKLSQGNRYRRYGYGYGNNNNADSYNRSAGNEASDEEKVGDLYLYNIDGRTTISTNQKKQVSFLDVAGVSAQRGYRFECYWGCRHEEPVSAVSVLKFNTGKKGGLGNALPAGVVRVYMRDDKGKARFVGESNIDHTPTGSDMEMATGYAFDVKIFPILEKREKIPWKRWEDTVEYRIYTAGGLATVRSTQITSTSTFWENTIRYNITNARSVPVTVDIWQNELRGWYEETRITDESIKGVQVDADRRKWQVPVPANGKTDLVVTFLTTY
ncbi:DUF4139 domain-containing protein [Sphingorhabdus arenilitoris]|uniref:DUF4139 domain-containing protein n=1 Tax=Sphingorhabdus arenilitoris TaxID=1490041 RepID=A0ABV8RIK9_9SPHN